jgi:prevent-host-death family protein
MGEIGVREAKARLSELLERVEGGEVLTLTRHGKPVARLVPIAERRPGLLKGRIGMAPDFDATPSWLVDAFEGGDADDPLQP